jgi:transposase
MAELETLLPAAEHVLIEHLRITPALIEIQLRCSDAVADCPACGSSSSHIQSRYTRTVDDLPWRGTPVRLRWKVRRFFCHQPTCRRRIFAEQIPALAKKRGRSTPRRDEALVAIGLEAGGEPGARLGRELGLITSGDTILRRLRLSAPTLLLCRAANRELTEIGIDDFALRRGQRYGTILVDHHSHHVVDLLPERSSESAAQWLKGHPSIKLVTRDRAGAYAKAVAQALPQALQVADRWHLTANLHEALVRSLDRSLSPERGSCRHQSQGRGQRGDKSDTAAGFTDPSCGASSLASSRAQNGSRSCGARASGRG